MSAEEIELVRRSSQALARREVAPHLRALEHHPDEPLPPGLVGALLGSGIGDAALADDDAPFAAALQALAETAAAPAVMLLAHGFGARLLRGAPPEGLVAWPIYAEPGVPDLALHWKERPRGFSLEGTAPLVVNAPIATRLVVPAVSRQDGTLAIFALDAGAPGVSVGETLWTLGMRGAPTADVVFGRARAGAAQLLARGAEAIALLAATADHLLSAAAAIGAGVVTTAARQAAAYAREREQGGVPIVQHDEVRTLLAELLADADFCRDAAARLAAKGGLSARARASLFVRAKHAAARATTDGVQLLGGNGYMEEYGQERCMRDARQAQCLLGRADAWRQALVDRWVAEDATGSVL